MNTYLIYYTIKGVITMRPLSVIVKSDNEKKAKIEAENKIRKIDEFVKHGYEFSVI